MTQEEHDWLREIREHVARVEKQTAETHQWLFSEPRDGRKSRARRIDLAIRYADAGTITFKVFAAVSGALGLMAVAVNSIAALRKFLP